MAISEENLNKTLQLYANPLTIQTTALTTLQNHVLNGQEIVDGNNVFTFLLEFMATMTAGAAGDAINTFMSLYPSKASTSSDLYKHMSDFDYVNLYSTPSTTKVTLMFDRNFLINNAVVDSANKAYHKIIIPSQSTFKIGNYNFGIHYPIEILIKKNISSSGIVDYASSTFTILWDTDEYTPLQSLKTNIIEHRFYTKGGITLLCMEIPIHQFSVKTYNEVVSPASGFIRRYTFTDKFYAIRVFENSTGNWVELHQTLSDTIYDVTLPTAKVRVLTDTNTIELVIPQIYINNGMIGDKVLVKLYTSLGNLDLDISNYNEDQFSASFIINDDIVNTGYSDMLKYINFLQIIPSVSSISGGSSGLTFEELRSRVIHDSTYDVIITPRDLSNYFEDHGYSVSKYIDNVTNRIFFAHKALVDYKGNVIGAGYYNTIFTSLMFTKTIDSDTAEEYIENYENIKPISDTSVMILPNNLYKYNADTDSMHLLTDADIDRLNKLDKQSMVNEFNKDIYSYSPFHIKFTTTPTPNCLCYDLLNPKISNMSFVGENPNLATQVSIYSYGIEHLTNGSNGYNVYVNLYRTDDILDVAVVDYGSTTLIQNILVLLTNTTDSGTSTYILGEYIGTTTDTNLPIMRFNFGTKYKLTDDELLDINTFNDASGLNTIYVNLTNTYKVMTFIRDGLLSGTNNMQQVDTTKFPSITKGYTWLSTQTLDITLGNRIDMLHNTISTTLGSATPVDTPTTAFATYPRDIYERFEKEDLLVLNPETQELEVPAEDLYKIGMLKYPLVKLHKQGDIILSAINDTTTPPTCKLSKPPLIDTIYISSAEVSSVNGIYLLVDDTVTYQQRIWKKEISSINNEYCTITFKTVDASNKKLNQWCITYHASNGTETLFYRTNNIESPPTPVSGIWVLQAQPSLTASISVYQIEADAANSEYSLALQEPYSATSWAENVWLKSNDALYVYNCGVPLVNGKYELATNTFGSDRIWTKISTINNITTLHTIYYNSEESKWILAETQDNIETTLFTALDDNPNTDPWNDNWISLNILNLPLPSFSILNSDATSHKIVVEDILKYVESTLTTSLIFDTIEDTKKVVSYNAITGVGTITDPVSGIVMFLNTKDTLQTPSTILTTPYVSETDPTKTVGSGTGAVYIRDFELNEFDPTNYLTYAQLQDFFNLYDNPVYLVTIEDTLADKYKLPKYIVNKIIKWRTPWKKLIDASSVDTLTEYLANVGSLNGWTIEEIRTAQNKVQIAIDSYANIEALTVSETLVDGDYVWVEDIDTMFTIEDIPIFGDEYIGGSVGAICRVDITEGFSNTYTLICIGANLEEAKSIISSRSSHHGLMYSLYEKLTDEEYTLKYISILTKDYKNIDVDITNSSWQQVDKWPWDVTTWININSGLLESNINITLDELVTSAIVEHGSNEAIVENGIVTEDTSTRSVIYNTAMLHIDHTLSISNELQHLNYKETVLQTLRQHFNVLDAAKVSLLEQTSLYFRPIRTIGMGNFKYMTDGIISLPLAMTMELRLHVEASVISNSHLREMIEKNIYSIVAKHLENGDISQTNITRDILNELGDSIVYVDVLGINGQQDLQTLIPKDYSFSPYIKQTLYVKDDGSIGTKSGISIKWVIV